MTPQQPQSKDWERKWIEEFTTPNWAGERQLDQICVTNHTKDTPIIQEFAPIVTKHIEYIHTLLAEERSRIVGKALDALYLHEEEDDSRGECDADGLYCRSGCVGDAGKRIRALLDTKPNDTKHE